MYRRPLAVVAFEDTPMSNFASLARRCATGLVAAQMLFGAVSVTTLALAAPAHAAVAEEHGAWKGFTTTIDGRPVFGVMADMTKGGTTAFLAKDGGLELVITNPTWNFEPGVTVPVTLTIDGQTYTGTGTSVGKDMIEMKGIGRNILAMFVDGAEAEVDVGNGAIVWTLDLHGFTASMADALRLFQA